MAKRGLMVRDRQRLDMAFGEHLQEQGDGAPHTYEDFASLTPKGLPTEQVTAK